MSRPEGRRFEFEVLGSDVVWNGEIPYVDFQEAIGFVLRKQPDSWHPLRPPTKLGSELLCAVKSALNQEIDSRCLEGVKEYLVENTGLYVALGTPADFLHQTDAVICCDLGFVCLIVTIDLKVEDCGEDDLPRDNHVIITRRDFTEIASNGVLRLNNIAGVIVEQLVLQLEQFEILVEKPPVS